MALNVLRGAPAVPPLCRETQSLGQQMLNATVGTNGLRNRHYTRNRSPAALKMHGTNCFVDFSGIVTAAHENV